MTSSVGKRVSREGVEEKPGSRRSFRYTSYGIKQTRTPEEKVKFLKRAMKLVQNVKVGRSSKK